MPDQKLIELLDRNDVRYDTIEHSPAFTAQEVAAAAHIPGKELAKPVIVKLDGRMAMAVLPASHQVELDALARAAGAEHAELAEESDFEERFPGSELGAMPPFGSLYGLPLYVDLTLEEDEEIAFSAGSHSEVIRMRYDDYRRLAEPHVARFGRKAD
jgi:Ala-tRNA(Pro) deacylase